MSKCQSFLRTQVSGLYVLHIVSTSSASCEYSCGRRIRCNSHCCVHTHSHALMTVLPDLYTNPSKWRRTHVGHWIVQRIVTRVSHDVIAEECNMSNCSPPRAQISSIAAIGQSVSKFCVTRDGSLFGIPIDNHGSVSSINFFP